MRYFIIEKETGRKFGIHSRGMRKDVFGSKGAATRVMNANNLHETHDMVPVNEYKPVMVTRINLMSGKPYEEDINTPSCCSPASETYWSM